ncbi:MAG: hypothetical protein WCP17_00895 [bacterium]
MKKEEPSQGQGERQGYYTLMAEGHRVPPSPKRGDGKVEVKQRDAVDYDPFTFYVK